MGAPQGEDICTILEGGCVPVFRGELWWSSFLLITEGSSWWSSRVAHGAAKPPHCTPNGWHIKVEACLVAVVVHARSKIVGVALASVSAAQGFSVGLFLSVWPVCYCHMRCLQRSVPDPRCKICISLNKCMHHSGPGACQAVIAWQAPLTLTAGLTKILLIKPLSLQDLVGLCALCALLCPN